jgi:hypothetical protein
MQAGSCHRADGDRYLRLSRPWAMVRVGEAGSDCDYRTLELLHASSVTGPWKLGRLVLAAHVSGAKTQLEAAR